MSTRMPIVGGNWKMNLDRAAAIELADDVASSAIATGEACEVALFPPFPYLEAVGTTIDRHRSSVMLGAQDVYHETAGAFTGEVSASMLLDLNTAWVLVGHSERRHVLGETDDVVAAKFRAALAAGLEVILCIGETKYQRDEDQTHTVLDAQLTSALRGTDTHAMADVVIAYEPVWAIGTGRTATPEDAASEHAFIRARLGTLFDASVAESTRIQYGGSVKPSNAAQLMAVDDVDGFLVGGASLDSHQFLDIIAAANGVASNSYRKAPNA